MPNPNPNSPGYLGQNFQNLLQGCFTCGVLTVDATGKISNATPDAERILRSLSGKPDSLTPELQSIIGEARSAGRALANRKIASHPGVSVCAIPLSPGSDVTILQLRQFSAADKLERHLQQLDQLASAGTLSAGMTHEIKNALVAVRTFVDLLLEKNKDDELASLVRHELSRVEGIITHMLRFATPAQHTFANVSLHKVLDHSLRLIQHRVGSRLINLSRQFDAAPDSLHGNARELEQAFVNLLLNAIEAINASGLLEISTTVVFKDAGTLREGDSPKVLCVRIVDTGVGITPDNMQRLFEPFFTTKEKGTGLGLAVTRRIIEEHKGSIKVESQPGKGTQFTVLLPAH